MSLTPPLNLKNFQSYAPYETWLQVTDVIFIRTKKDMLLSKQHKNQ
jgi:hypothetical protein